MENTTINDIDFEKFRLYLQSEFEKRKSHNSSYSLRAYAKSLDIHASCLSVILRGKRPLTNTLVERFLEKLSLNEDNLNQLYKGENYQYELLPIDVVSLLSDWKHDAVLELIKFEDFRYDEKWMASVLDISITEIQITIERLVRLKLVEIRDHQLILLQENNEVEVDKVTTAALKNYQIDALKNSRFAIENIDIEKRYHGTSVIAIDEKDLPLAKSMLRDFRKKFSHNIQNKNLNKVYQLNIGFYPLSKDHL